MNDSRELMSDRERAYLEAKEGVSHVAWELCDRWLKRWHEEHPDDPRDDLALILEVYGNAALAN